MKNSDKKSKPFGIRFLETPTEKELKELNGGIGKIGGHGGGLHSMDIFRSNGVWHYNT